MSRLSLKKYPVSKDNKSLDAGCFYMPHETFSVDTLKYRQNYFNIFMCIVCVYSILHLR